MENKNGQVRIIEAAIAVMLFFAFIIFVQQQNPRTDISNSIYKIQHQILVEMEKNESLRDSVMNGNVSRVLDYARFRLQPYNLNIEMSICSTRESCICKNCPAGKQIYGDNIIISSSLSGYDPKKLSMFIWS